MKISLFRYMSDKEHTMLLKGAIYSHTDHAQLRQTASTAHGFCFGIGDAKQAVEQSRYLKGIVIMQWLMVGIADTDYFTQCKGRYVSKFDNEGNPLEWKYGDEFCRDCYQMKYFDNLHFYPINGMSETTRLAIIDRYAIDREKMLLQFTNRIAARNNLRNTVKANLADNDFTRILKRQ